MDAEGSGGRTAPGPPLGGCGIWRVWAQPRKNGSANTAGGILTGRVYADPGEDIRRSAQVCDDREDGEREACDRGGFEHPERLPQCTHRRHRVVDVRTGGVHDRAE